MLKNTLAGLIFSSLAFGSLISAQNDPSGSIITLTLYNADTDEVIGVLQDGATIDFTALGTENISVVAETNPEQVGSVRFELDGQAISTENNAPYAITGDSNGGKDFNAWPIAPGAYTLTVTPYSGSSAGGAAGVPLTVAFTVIDMVATPVATPEPEVPAVTPEPSVPVATQETQKAAESPAATGFPSDMQRSRFAVSAVEDSGVRDSVLISDDGFGGSIIVVLVRGTQPGESYPATIRQGNCGDNGESIITLENVDGRSGLSVTPVGIAYPDLIGQGLYLDIQSPDATGAVACGGLSP